MKVLTATEIEEVLRTHPQWKMQEGKLMREWTFKDFVQAMVFVNRAAELAEAAGHHPDIDIRYNHVQLRLISHDTGGITQRDATMVASLDSQLETTT
ncbi:MAG: transcriptional coactivator/pterin dehydratase [Edaphobacter sp.]|jgi:4a-hydroxytetrahydrobiopterin dehydratase|nr:transcriptional coactivator/pterin dehydratase [Edaphobacter sp.]MCU1319618.1 transcriptional coactivator/pterin dehydratase [Edaphobacter sp.]